MPSDPKESIQSALAKGVADTSTLVETADIKLGLSPGGTATLEDIVSLGLPHSDAASLTSSGMSDLGVPRSDAPALVEYTQSSIDKMIADAAGLEDAIEFTVSRSSTDLAVTKTDSPDPVLVGTSLTYTVTVTNKAPSEATGVTLTDILAKDVSFVSASEGCTEAGGTVTCTIGALPGGDNATVTIVVVPNSAGDLSNSASVEGDRRDPNPDDNTVTATTTVNPAADLVVTKSDFPDPVLVGDTLTYTVTVTNNGPSNATGVVLTDTLPTDVTFPSAVTTQGSCNYASGSVTCLLGDLGSGASATVTITVTPAEGASGSTITNKANVTSEVSDPDAGNNSANEGTKVQIPAEADLSVVKSDTPDPVFVGNPLTYTLTVANDGPERATKVVLTDILPANVTFGSALPSQGSCSEASGTVACDLGAINNGASATVTITATPTPAAGGTAVTNTASVTSEVTDSNVANDSASQSTLVEPLADLSLTKVDSPDPALAGGLLTYDLVVTNNGPSRALEVVVTDTLPPNIIFGLALASNGSCRQALGIVTCNLGNINSGEDVTVTITVTPTSAADHTTITNTASVVSEVADPDESNNSAGQNTDIFPSADLSVIKKDPPNGVVTGKQLIYQVTVTNDGPSDATGVTLTDTLPEGVRFDSATPSQGTCGETSGTVTCSLGAINNGAKATITTVVTVEVDVSVGEFETITSRASVLGSENDPFPANNEDEAATEVYLDDDGDGVGEQVEAGAPNGGDGNNDGKPDKEQDNVTSLHNAVDEQYVTIESDEETQLADVTATENPSPLDAPEGEEFPAGFFGFEVDNLRGAVATTVEVLFPEGTTVIGYWKYGPTPADPAPHWYEFLFEEATRTGAFIDNNKVTLHFVDGQKGDDDLEENGRIVDIGGPVFEPADLSLIKLDSPDPALVGAPLTYSLVVTNNGPSLATGVVLTDSLPANVTFESVTRDQGTCNHELGTVTCELGDISNLAQVNVAITVTPEEAKTGTTGGTEIINEASVTATEHDNDVNNNTATQETVVNRQADTSVTKTAEPDPVRVEQPLTYDVVVTNHGPSQATNVIMTDTLPGTVNFESVVTSQGSCSHASGTVTCNLGRLDSGAIANVVIVVIPTVEAGGTTIINRVSVTSDVDDFKLENDATEQQTVVLRSADLSVTKNDTPDPVLVGNTLTYALTVTNGGPSLATDVVLTDTLPPNVTFESVMQSQGNCNESSGTVTCILGAIIRGASATATILVTADSTGDLINTAGVTAAEIDPNTGDNSASGTTVVIFIADLSLAKASNPDRVTVGQSLTYTLTVTNSGPSDATEVILTDSLPDGVSFESAAASQGDCSGAAVVICAIGTLGSGDNATVTIEVTAGAAGTIVNTANVVSAAQDPNTDDNSASETTVVNPQSLDSGPLADEGGLSRSGTGRLLPDIHSIRHK